MQMTARDTITRMRSSEEELVDRVWEQLSFVCVCMGGILGLAGERKEMDPLFMGRQRNAILGVWNEGGEVSCLGRF